MRVQAVSKARPPRWRPRPPRDRSSLTKAIALPPPAGSGVYELTGLGRSLEPVVLALSRWGSRLVEEEPREGDDVRPSWAVVAVRSAIGTSVLGVRAGTYEFRIDGETFHLRVEEDEGTELRQGPAQAPDLALAGEAGTFLAVASGRLGPEEAVRSGVLRVEGGPEENPGALLTRCLALIGPAAG